MWPAFSCGFYVKRKKKFITKIWTLFPANRVLFSEKKPLLVGKDPQKKWVNIKLSSLQNSNLHWSCHMVKTESNYLSGSCSHLHTPEGICKTLVIFLLIYADLALLQCLISQHFHTLSYHSMPKRLIWNYYSLMCTSQVKIVHHIFRLCQWIWRGISHSHSSVDVHRELWNCLDILLGRLHW